MSPQEELPVVAALRKLSIFGADQLGAFREHFAELAEVLGADIPTRLGVHLERWVRVGESGACILTGNAGTGKTAAAEAFCRAAGGRPPRREEDGLVEVAAGRWVAKDLSGLPDDGARSEALARALELGAGAQVLVCANEGVLRDAAEALGSEALSELLGRALRTGAAQDGGVLIVNVNRQRPTAPGLWEAVVSYVTRPELWGGCDGCPRSERAGCPFVDNAEHLRAPEARAGLRRLMQLGAGEAVPTLREVLAILAHALIGGGTCAEVKERVRDQGLSGFSAAEAYYSLALGESLAAETVERSPLLAGMRRAGLGTMADLEADKWLRDPTAAPAGVQALAGAPDNGDGEPELAGSRSHLDRVRTIVGTMTFYRLGETVTTSEDAARVDAAVHALVDGEPAALSLWRRRLYFEAPEALGGGDAAAGRLLRFRFFAGLLDLARRAAAGADTAVELAELVKGLNVLVTGFASPNEGLLVPDPSCLFARNPGSFRPARPSLIQGQVDVSRLSLAPPDSGLVEELLDVDHIEVDLIVDGDPLLALRIRPRMYEAIREAAAYQGPVGHGTAEMTDLRGFYGRLAASEGRDDRLRVADPGSSPPALVTVTLPHFGL
ncbi:MAG: ATP-binding protein [Actinomycetota bacterium]|nr:ATP-binding protein [Actinomycetota bacterium]